MKSVNVACNECTCWATETERARLELDDVRRERDEARRELVAMAEDRDELLTHVVHLTDDVRRLQAQLRDEERENGALRRRLREGGR